MEQTNLGPGIKLIAAVAVLVGSLAQSGGFFLHMVIGQPGARSLGNTITNLGAAILVLSILVLVYGLITTKQGADMRRNPYYYVLRIIVPALIGLMSISWAVHLQFHMMSQ